MLSALPDVMPTQSNEPWTLLIELIDASLMKGHPQGAGVYTVVALKIAQQITSAEQEVGLWLRLLTLALADRKPPDDGRMSFALSAFLAHTRQRNLSITQLAALTELTVGQSKAIHFHSVNEHLQTSLKIGPDDTVLIVLNDLDSTPATRFFLAALTCFFTAFREDIDREFLSVPLESGLYIRCSIVDVSNAPEDIQRMLGTPSASPVSISMFEPKSGRAHEMFIACRPDLQERCQGDTMKGTELQFMYADVLRALLTMALGGEIEAEVLRPKIVSLIRKTIQ